MTVVGGKLLKTFMINLKNFGMMISAKCRQSGLRKFTFVRLKINEFSETETNVGI